MLDLHDTKILVVDDDEDIARTYRKILEREGAAVKIAFSGKSAFEELQKHRFDLMILDVKLPDVMGDEIVKKVRERNTETSIVMITGYPEFQNCIDTLDYGVHKILLKPISPLEIIRVAKEAKSSSSVK